jgi:hypothetical protein
MHCGNGVIMHCAQVVVALHDMLDQVDRAEEAFASEMREAGVWGQLALLQISEFGRSLRSNGLGTDHGVSRRERELEVAAVCPTITHTFPCPFLRLRAMLIVCARC